MKISIQTKTSLFGNQEIEFFTQLIKWNFCEKQCFMRTNSLIIEPSVPEYSETFQKIKYKIQHYRTNVNYLFTNGIAFNLGA